MTETATAYRADTTFDQLAQRNAELEEDKAQLLDEIGRLRQGITRARLFAGEHLPAREGLTVVHMLETTLGGEQ